MDARQKHREQVRERSRRLLQLAKDGDPSAVAWYENRKKQIYRRQKERSKFDSEFAEKRKAQKKLWLTSDGGVRLRSRISANRKEAARSRMNEARSAAFGNLSDKWIHQLKKIALRGRSELNSFRHMYGQGSPFGAWTRRFMKMAYSHTHTKRTASKRNVGPATEESWESSIDRCVKNSRTRFNDFVKNKSCPWEAVIRGMISANSRRSRGLCKS